jgi:predicted nucleotidyltransferase
MAPPAVQNLPKTAIPLPVAAIADFCARWKVKEFAVFGSVLREDFGPQSDVDVMVVFEPRARPSLFDLAGMQEELESLFKRKVDVLTRRGVEGMPNPRRKASILASARVIYAR